ncbi:MAG: hypothetical protein U0871_19885 [Gemmataceae bacterium]
MDPIEAAVRRYQVIMPDPRVAGGDLPVDALSDWLTGDVGRVVACYARRPRFREYAGWSVCALTPGSPGDARQRVDAVAVAAVRHARLITAVLRTPLGRAARRLVPNQPVGWEVQTESGPVWQPDPTDADFDQQVWFVRHVSRAGRPVWADLVDPADYFGPVAAWPLWKPVHQGAGTIPFRVCLNPQRHVVGDFVSGGLLRRVDALVTWLGVVRLALFLASGGQPPTAEQRAMMADVIGFDEDVERLTKVCHDPVSHPLRVACVTLTQAYVGFHPAPDVDWLGLPAAVVENGRWGLQTQLKHARSVDPVVGVRPPSGSSGGCTPTTSRCRPARRRSPPAELVFTANPPAACWEGRPLPVEWGRHRRAGRCSAPSPGGAAGGRRWASPTCSRTGASCRPCRPCSAG